ncbi:MAG: GlsB/YeaQ/YmgE family stress response membrane protein [Bacteroidota bacterium]
MGLLYAIIIGSIAGWLAGQIMKGAGFGILWNIVIGIIGGAVGNFVFGLLGFHSYGLIADIISATVGAVILLFIVGKIRS